MKRLLMISGDRAIARGKRGAFYNTLEGLHNHWDHIDVITPSIGMNVSQVLFGNVTIHSSPWPLLLQPLFIWKKGVQIFNRQPFDIMTVHEYPPFYNGIGAWLLHRDIGIPYVLEIMHIAGYPRAGSLKERIYKALMKLWVRFDAKPARAVRVINQQETPQFLVKAGVSETKLVYIPAFYIDFETFKPDTQIEKRFDCLFVGRLVENKGINLFLEALKTSSRSGCIVGDGPERKRILKFIEDHNLSDRIHLHGWAADAQEVAQLMNASRLLIMPSYNEGGPRVVLEAMACGVPVVATAVGIVKDVVQDGESGVVVLWNAEKIRNTIEKILSDEGLYQKISKHGLMVVKTFERQAALKNYAEKIQQYIP